MARTAGSIPASKVLPGIVLALVILSVLPAATSLPVQGTFDNSWYLSTVPPSTSAIINGVLETRQSNPNATGYTNSYYDTAQVGSFPWQGQPTTQPLQYNMINVTLQFQNRTLQPGSRYQIYIGLYYYLPTGTVQGCSTTLDNQGCHTYQWFDTEARLAENINGTDTMPGTENTYDAHNSYGYDTVLDQLQPGQQGNLTSFNIETQFQNAATNWNIPTVTPAHGSRSRNSRLLLPNTQRRLVHRPTRQHDPVPLAVTNPVTNTTTPAPDTPNTTIHIPASRTIGNMPPMPSRKLCPNTSLARLHRRTSRLHNPTRHPTSQQTHPPISNQENHYAPPCTSTPFCVCS